MARFKPPTQAQAMPDTFWGRYSIPVGVSVIRDGDTYENVPTPTEDDFEAAGVEGTDWFRGGYVYKISPALAEALAAAGYVIAYTDYGDGGYGEGFYGGTE